jgi:hypothetical protein
MADGQVKDQDQLTDEELRRQAAAELAARQAAANAAPEESRATKLQVGSTAQPIPTIPPTQDLSAPAPDVTGLKPIASPSLATTAPARPGRPTAPVGSIEDTQNQLSELRWQNENPLGTPANQPGTLGRIKHTLGKIGNVAGDIFIPNVMAETPGTQLYRQTRERELTNLLGQQQEKASEAGLRNVQEQNLQSEIAARTNPKPKLLPGDENVATDAQGNRYQRYEMPDQSTAWAPEGQIPALRQIAAPSTPTGGLTPIAAPSAPTPAATAAPEATGGAPALAPGALPAGAVAGKPKAETDETHFIAKFLKDNNLPNTADNIAKARASYNSGGPIGDARAKELSVQVSNLLKGTGADAAGYTISAQATSKEADEVVKAAREEANAARARNAPEAAQTRKDAHTMGYANDPSGKLVYASKADADKWGSTFEEMKPDGVNKDRGMIRQLNDIQKNVSAYTKALNGPTGPLEHVKAMQRIEAGINPSDVEKMGYLTLGAAASMMEQGEVGKSWNELNPQERAIMIGYLRAKGAMIAYNKVVSGSAKTNKEALEVEWANLPQPYVGATVANDQMRAMQENLDQVNEGYPTNLPGMHVPENIREQTEGKAGGAPPAGAKIRNYNTATGRLE